MKITREEVEHIARLAYLNMNDMEIERITKQLDGILSYVAKLDALNTTKVKPTSLQVTNNVFREDEVMESLERKEILANCSNQNGETFIVPRIIG